MKAKRILILLLTLCISAAANAGITGMACAGDGDGAIEMGLPELTSNGLEENVPAYTMAIGGYQVESKAHVVGHFEVDGDPIVTILETVENQTGFTWTGYHIDFGMPQTFSLLAIYAPLGWTYAYTGPTAGQPLPGDFSPGIGTVVSIDFFATAGHEIAQLDSGDFGFKVKFLGTADFSSEQVAIPEPATLSLLAISGLALLRRKNA